VATVLNGQFDDPLELALNVRGKRVIQSYCMGADSGVVVLNPEALRSGVAPFFADLIPATSSHEVLRHGPSASNPRAKLRFCPSQDDLISPTQ
jgi:hypothetical protein